MDQTLKKRLIGAAILIVLAAVFLPMFLGDQAAQQEGSTRLPLEIPAAPDRDMSQVVLPLEGDSADPNAIAAVDATAAPVTDATQPATDAATSTEPVTADAPTAPAAAPALQADDAATTTPATNDAAPTPVTAAPTSTAPAIASADDARYWVSLGSYGQAANAERVAAGARARGIAIARDTVNTSGQDLIRLRAGPYATRAQAEQARQLLIAAVPDAQPKVEEIEQATTADAAANVAAGAWAVQVGAFAQAATATQLVTRLRSAGYPAFVERRGDSHAVRVGPFVRRTEAETQKQRLKSSHQLDGLIVAHSG